MSEPANTTLPGQTYTGEAPFPGVDKPVPARTSGESQPASHAAPTDVAPADLEVLEPRSTVDEDKPEPAGKGKPKG